MDKDFWTNDELDSFVEWDLGERKAFGFAKEVDFFD